LANPQTFPGRPRISLALDHSVSGSTVNWSIRIFETLSQPTYNLNLFDNNFSYNFSSGGGPELSGIPFIYDFRPTGLQSITLASGSFTATSSSFTATATVSGQSDQIGTASVDQVINVVLAPVWSTGTTRPAATRGSFYSTTVTASPSTGYSLVGQSGGTGTYSLTNNNTNAVISGTPSATGTASVTVRAINNSFTTDRTFTFTVNPALPVFSDASVNSLATRNVAYSDSVSASETASYSVRNSDNTGAGTLPDGLTLTTTGVGAGTISGAPTTVGITSFRIRATNVTGSTDTEILTIEVRNNLGKRQTSSGFQNIETSRRFDGTTWIQTTVSKRFDGTSWVDVSNS